MTETLGQSPSEPEGRATRPARPTRPDHVGTAFAATAASAATAWGSVRAGAAAHGEAAEAADATLMRRVVAGDGEAFRVLVLRYQNPLVNYLTRLTRCRDRGQELAQEAFVRLYERRHQYRETGQLAAYLYRIATNLVRSEERRRRRFSLLLPKVRAASAAASEAPQERASLANEAVEQVTLGLASLPLRYRAPLVLREIEGLAYREIAAVLRTNEGTIKSRINRGKRLLRRALERYWTGATT